MPASPFSFAWVLPTETVFGPEHLIEDEKIAALSFEQTEGDFGALSIDVKNKRDGGLLQASRKQWCWVGYKGDPIFFGRLIGVPTDLVKNMITLLFVARPQDYAAVKTSLADTLKVPGLYDPLFVDDAHVDDADTVLEAYGALWSYDRVTHAIGMSDYLVGEDGTNDFAPEDVPADSVGMRLNQTPLRSVIVDAVINWTQAASGVVDLGSKTFLTYTGMSIIQDWPKTGAGLKGGWAVDFGEAKDVYDIEATENTEFSWNWHNNQKEHANGDTMSDSGSSSTPIFADTFPVESSVLHLIQQTGVNDPFSDPPINIDAHIERTTMYVPLWKVVTQLRLRYDTERQRQEHVRFQLNANVQPIVTLPGEDEAVTISISSRPVSDLVPGELTIPIGDVRRRSYLPTDRGILSLEYLIHLAEAHLKLRARAVEIDFSCSFERALELSMRKNARLFDDRLPGGQATGKVIKYSFLADGSGTQSGAVTIGCAIGYGESVVPVAGTPRYVAEGYFNVGEVQKYDGQVIVSASGNVGYSVPIDAPVDDGLDFLRGLQAANVVTYDAVTGTAEEQALLIREAFHADVTAAHVGDNPQKTSESKKAILELNKKGVVETLKANPVKYEFHLKPVNGGPFETAYDIVVTDLEIPMMINLEVSTASGRIKVRDGSDISSIAGTVT